MNAPSSSRALGPLLGVLLAIPWVALAADPAKPSKPAHHAVRELAGWTVRVDDRLESGEDAAAGAAAVKLLEARLIAIAAVLPAKPLARLREVTIQIDRTHGELRSMQYHPSAGWLREHGYETNLVRCVHIPDAAYFASRFEAFRQPWAILHELAHAYHDQVLGFDEQRIRAAWERFRTGGRYESVPMITGRTARHYALTDPKEFFAEMTECYFGTNDFFPYVASELRREEPELFALLEEIWGPLPGR